MIDFVLLWVDGKDPKWQQDRERYANDKGDNRFVRFRDWDNLQYIFRAFEKFTPWVRKIHFVTYGHLPKWLDVSHPKLNIVMHDHYINKSYLPVFNANPLEISLHNIKDLSEHFIYFNDDFFIVKQLSKERFFKNGVPCDMAVSNALSSSAGVGHFVLNAMEVLNRHFDKYSAMKSNPSKWFSTKYGKDMLRNIALLPWPRFTGFVDHHQPQAFLKSTFEEIWSKEHDVLEKIMQSRFRSCSDINQYLFRYWQLAKGNFYPISMRDTKYITLSMKNITDGTVDKIVTEQKYSMICLNDSEDIKSDEEFKIAKKVIQNSFEKILPRKSTFEV